MRARTAMPFAAYLAIVCLALSFGPTALAGEAGPRDEVEREIIKYLAYENSEVFTFSDPFHLESTAGMDFQHWAGVLLVAHVKDGTEVSVLGGRIMDSETGLQASLTNLPPDSEQNASDRYLATVFHPAASGSGFPIGVSHDAPVTVTFHAKNTSLLNNSEADLNVDVYDIFHLTEGPGTTTLYPSDMVWATSEWEPIQGEPFPPYPPPIDDPYAHFVHLEFTTHIGPGLGSHFYAKKTGGVEIGIDHEHTAEDGANPDIRIYLEADPNNHVHEIHPNGSETFDVYVCFDCFGEGSGTRGTAFLLIRTFTGFKLSQMALLNGLDFGDAEVDGWTIAAGTDCVYPDIDGVVCVGVIQYLYLGVPGTLDIVPHPGTGREVLDCDFLSNCWCVHANLGVSVPPNPGDPDCECEPPNPVEDMSWGAIKSLFR